MEQTEKTDIVEPVTTDVKKENKIDKLMSGRWLLTLGVFIAIVMMSFANVRVVLKDPTQKPPFEMKELMVAVVVFYFTRPPNSEK
jgi:hypothetical protein